MPRLSLLAAVLALFAAAAHAAPPAEMKIVSFTGRLEIKLPGGSVLTVAPGATVPSVPPGAQVTVLSGQAVLSAGGVAVEADAGDSFAFSIDPQTGGVEVAATAGEVSVLVGGSEAKLGAGDKVEVTDSGSGQATLSIEAGSVPVTTDGTTTEVAAGGSTTTQSSTSSTSDPGTTSNTTSPTQDINSPVSGSTP
jgi:hypothetical protein